MSAAGRGEHASAAATLPPWPYPRLCAHRGAGKLAPENTLTAMRVGHAHGYAMVEFDVKLSADNVTFLLHDATLERTTSGRGRADALLVARLVATRRRRLALGQVRGRDAADVRRDRSLGARARRLLQRRDQADAGPRTRDRRGGRARCGVAVARCRGAAVAVVVRRRRRSRRRATPCPHCRARCWSTKLPPIGSTDSRDSNASRSTSITIALTHRIVATAHRHGYRVCCFTPNDPVAGRGTGRLGRRHDHHRRDRPGSRGRPCRPNAGLTDYSSKAFALRYR